MPKLTDNELDKLFRDAADRSSPEFDPQDWDDMATRLDHEERAAKARSMTLYSMVALLLVYSLLPQWKAKTEIQTASVFQSQTTENLTDVIGVEKKIDVAQHTSAQEKAQAEIKDEGTVQAKSIEPATTLQDGDVVKNDPGEAIKAIGRRKHHEPVVQSGNANPSGDADQSSKGTSLIASSAANQEKTSHEQTAIVELSTPKGNEVGSQDGIATNNDLDEDESPRAQRVLALSAFSEAPYHGSLMMLVADSITVGADPIIKPLALDSKAFNPETIIRREPLTLAHNWFVKLAVSPDFSSIDYTKPGDPGINIGVLGEYQLSDHFSISTGAIWSKKLYDLDNPDKSYGSGGYTSKAKTLNGDCRVLDIPINLTYYLFPQRRTNLFVTLGTSSYIMLKEQYIYTVWVNQREYQYEENYSHENNEWFSMLNISLGIQYRLTKHFLIQGEPFLKAPMSGVGAGKVNLMSTGVFFSLKYQITHH